MMSTHHAPFLRASQCTLRLYPENSPVPPTTKTKPGLLLLAVSRYFHSPRVPHSTMTGCVIFCFFRNMGRPNKKGQQISPAPVASIRYVVTSLRLYFIGSAIAAL